MRVFLVSSVAELGRRFPGRGLGLGRSGDWRIRGEVTAGAELGEAGADLGSVGSRLKQW